MTVSFGYLMKEGGWKRTYAGESNMSSRGRRRRGKIKNR